MAFQIFYDNVYAAKQKKIIDPLKLIGPYLNSTLRYTQKTMKEQEKNRVIML